MYHPGKDVIDKYANVLVNFALNNGKGVQRGEVVYLEVPECAKSLLFALQKAVLKAGAHYITNFIPDEGARHFYELAEEHHLDYFPEKLMRGRVEQMDHSIFIIAETNKKELEGISPGRIMRRQRALKQYREWRDEKENQGKFTWTLALYGTEAMAKEAGCSLEEYWAEIMRSCYLDKENPIEEWKKAFVEIGRVQEVLNAMMIDKLRIEAEGVDLFVKIGHGRKWLGGSGRNIPSFEVFISPDWRGTEGHIEFDQPLYRYGNLIEKVKLDFENGRVVKAEAESGENVLKEMIANENADKIGEFSLTDVRLSRIQRFMAETLFDENFGGEFGNTHIALGNAYQDSYTGNPADLSKKEWEDLGYNNSVVHTDIVSTRNRKVTAYLMNGETKIIYENGRFCI